MNFPEEIIDAIFEYERYILMNEHFTMHKYVLQDIEESVKVLLTNHHWHKRCYREINDDDFQRFTWKQSWTQQSLEGAATYMEKGKIVCSNQVPGEIDYFSYNCHPNYQTSFNDCQKPTHQEARVLNHK